MTNIKSRIVPVARHMKSRGEGQRNLSRKGDQFLTHLFPVRPLSIPLKHQKTLKCFKGVDKRCIGNKKVNDPILNKKFLD